MKQVLRFTPVFNPIAQTLDFTGFTDGQPFNQSCLMAVINDTRSALIYAVGQVGLGGQVTGNVMTLQYSTFNHSASDVLTVIYDANYAPLPIGSALSANQSAIASDGGSMVHVTNTPATQNVFIVNEQSLENVAVTNFPSTQNVSIISTGVTQNVSIVSAGITQNVAVLSGTVNVGNLPIIQNVNVTSGSLSIGNLPSTQNVALVSTGVTQNVSILATVALPVTGTFFQTTQNVAVISTVSTPVTGTVSVSNLPSTQNVIVLSTAALPTGANTIGNVGVIGTVPVSGTFFQPTQNVSIISAPVTQNVSLVASTFTQNVAVISSSSSPVAVNLTTQSSTYSVNNSTNGNSTAYSLTNTSTWTGTIENVINQPYMSVGVNSTQTVTLSVYQYIDAGGTIAEVPVKSFIVTGGIPFSTQIAVLGDYVKLTVTNNSGSTSTVYVDSYYDPILPLPDSLTQNGNFRVAVQESNDDYASFLDNTTTAGYVYFLTAAVGTTVAQALWKVSRMKTSNAQVQWANGNSNYTNYGTGYAALSYS